jgi:hypothetical protein
MNQRKLTLLGAAVAGALLAIPAVAADRNGSGTIDSGDRGVVAPQSVGNVTEYPSGMPAGRPVVPSTATPMNANESKPSLPQDQQAFRPAPRTDNPNLPNPVTPSAANESAPQPKALREPTNSSGMQGRPAVGATRSGTYESERVIVAPAVPAPVR